MHHLSFHAYRCNIEEENTMKKRAITLLLLLILSVMSMSGCTREEETIYNRSIVVDTQVLPFYESSLTYNAEPEEEIRTKLYTILNETLANLPGSIDYVIVNHEGEDLTDEFLVEKSPSHNEMKEIITKIKENGYLVVSKDAYRVTTIEKEIDALFDGKRQVVSATLEKVLKDNREAYKNKDYEGINQYLRKNSIKVYDPLPTQNN